ncbi:universal stress protein [Streptomyces sp. PmtG]
MKHHRTLSSSESRVRSGDHPVPRMVTAGIDGSYASMDAADWAAREALRHGVPLRLVHAGAPAAHPVRARRAARPADRARGVLDRAAITLAYGHPALEIHAQQPCGPVVPALLGASERAESLVLGSRGLAGFAGFLVGSVAAAVATRAERPVVLVRAGERPEDAHVPDADGAASRATPYRPVVLGLDVEDGENAGGAGDTETTENTARAGDALLAYAVAAAAARGAPLHVVHAWAVPPPRKAPSPAARSGLTDLTDLTDALGLEKRARDRLAAAVEPWRRARPHVEIVERTVFGRPGHHLLKAATGASLLVIGRRLAGGPRLGRTAHSAVHHVACPIAVVPHA